jgi:hypothetical protein
MRLLDWLFGKKNREIPKPQTPQIHTSPHQSKSDFIADTSKPQARTSQHQIRFNFLIYEENEEIEPNKWYQKSHWENKNFVSYSGYWDNDWKCSDEGKVKVVGISRGTRSLDFLSLAGLDSFKLYLEDKPDNPVNKHARKVIACATVDGKLISKHIGYLPDEIATKYAGIELDIRPRSAFIPTTPDLNLVLEVALLVRSARYMKRKN